MTTIKTLKASKAVVLVTAFLAIFALLSSGVNPAFAAAGSNISGSVTESVGGKPVGGVTVTITSANGGAGVTATTTTASPSGTYSFTAPDSQADWVITFTKTGYTTQAITGVNNATAQTKNAALVTAAEAASVTGVVRATNASSTTVLASGAGVTAFADGDITKTWYTTTDSNGAYALSLPAGNYTLRFAVSGYVDQFLGNVFAIGDATTFDIASGNTTTHDMNLYVAGTLSGTTTPAGVSVIVRKASGAIAATATSDPTTGAYSITTLSPGTYTVEFTKSGYITEWWNDSASFLGGTAVSVSSGGTTGSISPTLVATGAATQVANTGATATTALAAAEGQTLTAVSSGWPEAGTVLTYQWQSNTSGSWSDITNAITTTYVVKPADYGKTLRVAVTGSRLGYLPSATIYSTATSAVSHAFYVMPNPTISGTPSVGQTLTANEGSWSPLPDSFTYQWYHDGGVILGAQSRTYVVASTDSGYVITVAVTAVKTGYSGVSRTSAGTERVGQIMTQTPTPTVSGQVSVGKTLTANTGSWIPSGVSFSYQWKRSGTAISGATGNTYTLVAGDLGSTINVTVTGSLTGYASSTVTSASTPAVLDRLTATPTPGIEGSSVVGSVLAASTGTWAPAPVTLTYQWYRNNSAISGATAATYTLVQADNSASITVKVTGTKAGYGDDTVTSAAFLVGKVLTLHPVPLITGSEWVGQTLKAVGGKWNTGVALKYQWLRNGAAITSATGSSYKLVTADVGKTISVSVTGSMIGYISKTETSAVSKVIATGKPFTKAAIPTISGTGRVGQILKANVGTWSPSPAKYYYQWLRGGSAIPGATKSTYKLTESDKGFTISVSVKVARSGYATTAKISKATSAIK